MKLAKGCAAALAVLAFGPLAPVAQASDACTVVLCLTFSKWDEISQCVPPVRRALRDAALGKPPKRCKMGRAPNSSQSGDADVQSIAADRTNCPQGHLQRVGRATRCAYDGALRVSVDGETWTNVWWDRDGNTATQNCPAAPAAAQIDNTSIESLLSETQDLATYDEAAAWAAASNTNAPIADCLGDECGPQGQNRPPLPADRNCDPPQVADVERDPRPGDGNPIP